MEQTTLSKYVKAMRKQYNLTQVDLSEKSGVGLRLVRELEQGKQTLRLDKVIQILNDNKVSLFIKNYNLETLNPDGTPNPVASLITTILLEVASMERRTILERVNSGRNQYIAKCRKEGIKMGRPSDYKKSDEAYKEQYQKELTLLRKGISLRNVHKLTNTSMNTLRKLKSMFL